MDADDGLDDDGGDAGWVDPDDRLWRHPSELNETPWPDSVAGTRGVAPPASDDGGRWRPPGGLWTVATLAGVIGAVLATGVIAVAGGLDRPSTTVVRPFEQVVMPASSSGAPTALRAVNDPVVGIAQRLRPTIVQLVVDGDKSHSTGSGVMFRSDGHILTNNHVLDGASSITAIMADGRELRAKVVGGDPETDIAVVSVNVPGGKDATVAPMGSARDLKMGQQVVAIGSPLGLAGGPSVTTGVVSALGREVEPRDGPPLLDMIQTDASIEPGSSGGALVDYDGNVIGITTAIAVSDKGTQSVGFAIPIDIARETADQLIATGKVVHVWMGVEGEDVDAATAGSLSIDGGALVRSVRDKSPADIADLHDRDIITAVDGRPVNSMGALIVALRSRHPNDQVSVTYLRDGETRSCTVTLAVRPKNL
jgi:S1-C subfamily serine protease